MKTSALRFFAYAVLLVGTLALAQAPTGGNQPAERPWEKQKVQGRDEVLRGIETRANANAEAEVQDVRNVIDDYEVDMYRLVMSVGKHYGMDTAYSIMSETVADKRLKWTDQVLPTLKLAGTTDVEKGLSLYRAYFQPKDQEIKIVEQTKDKVIFRRKDYVNAIAYACNALGLDPVEVNNKVYAPTMTTMLGKINPGLKHNFIKYDGDGWYEEMIALSPSK